MLVRIVDFLKHPEQVVPAFVWFERLENVHDGLSPALLFSAKSGFERIGRVKDAETVLPVLVTHSHRPDRSPEDVQCRAEIVDRVACNGTPSRRGAFAHAQSNDDFPRLLVDVGDRSIKVAFAKGWDLGFEISDVFFGPFDLDPTAGRPIGHLNLHGTGRHVT